ncbi:sigma factor-binding protein Crl [Oceanisphaera profunda]|uniref:Sigma factor-binding protein Crl n=1 Tax=Oceanisphaera profunda TaxID=1416627 RepID=A0A1Y0D6S9_9GAMM|nr:sigma factor-binding protein Crl [Oceanisphaera profunda]ART83253.1 sigma factor-binding protein Crl [Oceanisphaera profunda]
MSIDTVSHRKLVRVFTAIGPYLRELKSCETQYFFDCLSVCMSAKAEPEVREFWGWWLTLDTKDGEQFEFHYQLGFYNAKGEWLLKPIPKTHQAEVARTLRDFYDKLGVCMDGLALSVRPSEAQGKDHLLSPA